MLVLSIYGQQRKQTSKVAVKYQIRRALKKVLIRCHDQHYNMIC